MIRVLIPTDKEFKIYENEIKKMYEEMQSKICDSNSFEFIRDNTLFYMFLDNTELIGGIYYYKNKDKLFLNGFAGRKHFYENLECLTLSLSWFRSDIYAEAQNRASALCLLRCGFKYLKEENLYVYKR